MEQPVSDIMTIPEVAKWLRIDPRTVHRLLKDKLLPAKKVGGQWRFHRKNLETYMMSGDYQKKKVSK